MNNGTKERTAARILTSIGTVMAVWKVVFEFVLAEVGEVWIAALVATIIACIVIAVDAWTTYYNNDYSPEASIGTDVTHKLKDDPTLMVEVFDPDGDDPDVLDEEEEDDEEDKEAPEDDEGGETIEEGEE